MPLAAPVMTATLSRRVSMGLRAPEPYLVF
jgi:hypothetical protein